MELDRPACDLCLGDRNYANGDCQHLAAALQQITGWDVALFDGAGCHVTVVAPDGQHLDIHGLRTADDIADAWDRATVEVIGHINDLGWLGCDVCICDLRAARRVLDEAGLLTSRFAATADWDIDRELDRELV